ncbi:glycoside hydrolase family 43 protein [Xylariaceae sp. FL1019]|nr:glycoside hydrolase family 43 protein [Xylariaceae sp. FL1019]
MTVLLLTLCFGLLAAGLPSHSQPQDVHSKQQIWPTIGLANVTKVEMTGLKGRSIMGPFMGVDFPDPSIISANGVWYAYATTSNGKKIPVATSQDTFVSQGQDQFTWTLTGNDALPDAGAWADNSLGIWAPDVQINDAGQFVMCTLCSDLEGADYTAWKTGGTHCIGVATSTTATGPFIPNSTPLICNDAGGGAIDASGYDDGTNRWILWKVDGSALGGATTLSTLQPMLYAGLGLQTGGVAREKYSTPIMIQQVARDAVTLVGSAYQILDNVGYNNNGIVEAPALYKLPAGGYVLFYSAHCYSSDNYDIEAAFSSTVCTSTVINGAYTNRIIVMNTANDYGIYGPGGLDLDPNGKSVVFHGRLNANDGHGIRELFAGDISISGSGSGGSVTY